MAFSISDFITSMLPGVSKSKGFGSYSSVCPDRLSNNPNKAWSRRKDKQNVKIIEPLKLTTPVFEDRVRFVCISDTHTYLERNKGFKIPYGDVLLHSGDLTVYGKPDEVNVVNEFLGTLPHPYKVVIAGNHDMSFDLEFLKSNTLSPFWTLNNRDFSRRLSSFGVKTVHEMMTNCIYLQDTAVEIYGIKIYGSPWSPGGGAWGFQANRGAPLIQKWNQIPDDTDILMTHGPPCGYGDCVVASKFTSLFGLRSEEDHAGCVDLLNTIQHRVRPKYHIFGHIHEGYGVTTDGQTTYVNASTCTVDYKPVNPPIIFDLPLPKDQVKKQEVPRGTYQALSWRPDVGSDEGEEEDNVVFCESS